MSKRIFDICFSTIGIIILSPLFIFICILIKIFSPGPVFYLSPRVGLNENNFNLVKFRTMYLNSDKSSITIGNDDPRITGIGKILRLTKLDEIPQLLNVLFGQMSFVGPRPDTPKYKEYYKRGYKYYYLYKPGITCYSSIYFSNESELYLNDENPEKTYIGKTIPKKVKLDKKYFLNNSILIDIKIIFHTLFKIFLINNSGKI